MFEAVIEAQDEGKSAMDAVEAIKGFGHLSKYRDIQQFVTSRAGDLQTLDADDQNKVEEVKLPRRRRPGLGHACGQPTIRGTENRPDQKLGH